MRRCLAKITLVACLLSSAALAHGQTLPVFDMGYSDAEVIGPLYERLSKSFRDFPAPEPRGIQNVIDSLPIPKAKGARGEDFTDSSLMEEIRKSGFVEKLLAKGS